PADCSFQLDLTGGAHQFASSCDLAKSALANAGVAYSTEPAPAGTPARIRIGQQTFIDSVNAQGRSTADLKAARTAFEARLRPALDAAGYPKTADPQRINYPIVLAILVVFIVAATALYGPQAAALVELFPTRIRYTALSFPYHVGTGWFGGLLP